jgi:pilus assembly protein Flp/PilA
MPYKIATLKHFASDERGATAIEYGLIAALIAIVIIAGVSSLGKNISTVFEKVSNNITTSTSS